MELRIIHFYPDLMNLYGSYANVSVLRRRLEALGCTVTVAPLEPGQSSDLAGADLLFMGAGTERSQRAAMADFARFGPEVRAKAEDGAALLFAGTAMELLGQEIQEPAEAGGTYAGIGLGSFVSVHGGQRIVGDVYGHTPLCGEPVVGFMNKCGLVRGVETPLLDRLDMGFGNEADRGPEGVHWKNVFASQLTGPLLVKNPRLLEAVTAALFTRRGWKLPDPLPRDEWAERAYTVTEEALRKRVNQQNYHRNHKIRDIR